MYTLLRDDIEQIDEAQLQPLLQQLPEWRRQQALRYKHLAGQRESTLAYLLLTQLLRQHYAILEPPTFTLTEHGKPQLTEHPHIHFNLSHCRQAVLCAVSDHPVGVDIECDRKITDALIRHTMNADEQRLIADSPTPTLTFLRLWTQKEAVVKLTGQGLTDDIPNLLPMAREQGILLHSTVSEAKGYAYCIAEQEPSQEI